MRDNRGFSLTELLITFAILSVVITTVASLMLLGSKQYTKGSADANMQKEAQLVVNQIEDMLMDINGGVSFEEVSGSYARLIMHNVTNVEGNTVYTQEIIRWDEPDQVLRYSKYPVVHNNVTNTYSVDTANPVFENELMAENITGFKVDLTDTKKEKDSSGGEIDVVQTVRLHLDCKGDGNSTTYSTSPVITLRNRMMLSDTPGLIIVNTPVIEETLSIYLIKGTNSRAPINYLTTTVKRNQTYELQAIINDRYVASNDDVTWSIAEASTTSNINNMGEFSVGETEPNSQLTIVASYGGKTATAIVRLEGSKEIVSVNIIQEPSGEAFKPIFSADVRLDGFSEEDKSKLVYKWSVSEPSKVGTFTDSGTTLTLPVIEDINNNGDNIKVTLKVYAPELGVDEAHGKTADYTFIIPSKDDTNSSYIVRGSGKQIYEYKPLTTQSYSSYEVYFCDANGVRKHEYDDLISQYVVVHSSQDKLFAIEIKEGLQANIDFYLKFVAYYGHDKYERIFYIPAVKLIGQNTQAKWQGFGIAHAGIEHRVIGYNPASWNESKYTVEVVQILSNAPTGVDIVATLGASRNIASGVRRDDISFALSGDTTGVKISDIKVHSVKVKIQMKDTEVFTYATLTFNK